MSAKSQYQSSPMSERVLRQSIAPDLHLRRDGKRAELLHKREEIGHAPVLGDLAVAHAHHVHCLELDFATGWRHAEELALVRTMVGFVGRHPVPIGKLPVGVRVEVPEGGAQNLVKARARQPCPACVPAAEYGRENLRQTIPRTPRNSRRLALPRCSAELLPSPLR